MAEINILLTTAISVAFIHTLIGFDHYVPFIALSRANNWTMKKTLLIVFLCGLGHVLSSVLLGFIGIGLSSAVSFLVDIENIRGTIATWFLIAFGLVYTIYGIRHAVRNKSHTHVTHDGHTIMHVHSQECGDHIHSKPQSKTSVNSFWGLFILLVLGPCEPLIPILMYPAATLNVFVLVLVVVSFSVCTIVTMLVMTFLGVKGVQLFKLEKLNRYTHAMAGLAILICGISVWALPI